MSALWPVQVAAHTRLEANAQIMATITGVFDGQAPSGVAKPYIVIGAGTETDASTMSNYGFSDTLLFHVFSDEISRNEACEIFDLMDKELREPLTIADHSPARLKLVSGEPFREEDGWQLPARYRVTTWESA